ncbi:peptidoglycan-binding domain-containing protein [Streptomyces sp. E-08]|uniref:peptidoglycan-binding domain-containing protein n=1 Tax=Streptomyces sp. E-08 TaxID=3404047 RepID=UPI003CE9570B
MGQPAVKAVQQGSGLTADGQVGPKTWKYLEYPMYGCGHWPRPRLLSEPGHARRPDGF